MHINTYNQYVVIDEDSTDLVEDLWQEVLSSCDKREEGRDVGEHAGKDERVFGLVVQHGLQQLHALIDGQLLHRARQRGGTGQDFISLSSNIILPYALLFCHFETAPFTSSSRFLKICATMHSMKTVIASHWTTDGDRREHRPSALLAIREHRGTSGLICCCRLYTFLHLRLLYPSGCLP